MKGIIFTADSVRAIIDGRKTQTRRVVKYENAKCMLDCSGPIIADAWVDPGLGGGAYLKVPCADGASQRVFSPHGVGDRVYVKETFAWGVCGPIYRADWGERSKIDPMQYPAHSKATWLSWVQHQAGALVHEGGWRSPMFMPRLASRLTLEIVAVRVERLQEITDADAIAEGCEGNPVDGHDGYPIGNAPRDEFKDGWDTINGKRAPWKSNPWVWVIEFRRVT